MNKQEKSTIRERQVPRYMSMIDYDLERIEKSLAVLRDNLVSVLKEDLSENEDDMEPKEVLVSFAGNLRGFHSRIKTILSTIDYMNEALEL